MRFSLCGIWIYKRYFKQVVNMNFEAKTYKRLGELLGSITGVIAMIIAVSAGSVSMGVIILIACTCVGFVLGTITEKRHEKK